jgi:hypothetical protein
MMSSLPDDMARWVFSEVPLSDELMTRAADALDACGEAHYTALHLRVLIQRPGDTQGMAVGEVRGICAALSRAGGHEALVAELHAAIVAVTPKEG